MPAFCANGHGMLLPPKFECAKCGYTARPESKKIVAEAKTTEVLVITPEDEAKLEVMPKMRAECPKCGHMEAYYRTQQTRKSDEPETAFLRCVACGHRWRKY
jgi:transcription factor S